MTKSDFPTDPNAETIGLPSDDSGKGSVPEPGKFVTTGMPSEIGRYKILGIIASGGMGVVYEAMQEAPRRRVALKIIKAGAASDMALHRFQFEAQTLAKLSHPNIAQIFEAGTWESDNVEVPFFAMEYIPGAQGIVEHAHKKDLSIRDRLELFGKICDAVHHGHQKGIIHRDLKPDNILVDNQGEPKIIDFGVARATDADLAVTTMQTTMGQLIGTLQYMSPEQCDADPDRIDTRSDVYALGVILFQLLSGKLPYDLRRQAIHEAVRVIKEQRPDSLGTISTTLKGDIDTIALKAMEKDRDRRYQSAAELANDIHHFLNNEPIIARPLSIGYQVRLFTKKYKRTCAAVLLLFVSIVFGIIGTTTGWVEANKQKEIAIEQRDIAEDGFEKILKMSNTFAGPFYKGIVKLNAALDIRKYVLDTTLGYLEDLQETAGDSPEIQAELALVHSRLGLYYGSIRTSNKGDFKKAFEHFEIATAIYGKMAKGDAPKNYFNLAVLNYRMFDVSLVADEFVSCLELLDASDKAIDIYIESFPDDIRGQRLKDNIAMSRLDTYIELGENEKADSLLNEVIKSRKQRASRYPNELIYQRDLANVFQRAGRIYTLQNDFDSAIQYFTQAKDILGAIVPKDKHNGRAPRDLAWAEYFLGETLVNGGNADKGLDHIEIALVLIRDHCVADITAANARNDVAIIVEAYVELCNENNLTKRAEENVRGVLLVLQPVVEQNPENYALAELYSKVKIFIPKDENVAAASE